MSKEKWLASSFHIALMSPVPLPPTNFSISEEFHDNMMTTVTLDWAPPQGSGPEAIVDNYTISISPAPPSQPALSPVFSPPWNVTLSHNEVYSINLTAVNCAGESRAVTLPSIEFSKLITYGIW